MLAEGEAGLTDDANWWSKYDVRPATTVVGGLCCTIDVVGLFVFSGFVCVCVCVCVCV